VERRRDVRLKPKDASDVIRLMGAEPAVEIGIRLAEITDDPMAGATVREGVGLLGDAVRPRPRPGVDLAVQALAAAMPEETIRAMPTGYTQALVSAYEQALA
jgi:hypothetical protein